MIRNGLHQHIERQPVEHEFIDRIFAAWDQSHAGELSFQVRRRSAFRERGGS